MQRSKQKRTFFAVTLNKNCENYFDSIVHRLKQQSGANGVRWTPTPNLHITLLFLGYLDAKACPALIDAVHEALEKMRIEMFEIHFQRVNFFPNQHHPKVIAAMTDLPIELGSLYYLLATTVKKFNIPIDDRPFLPHLTLGRCRTKKKPAIDLSEQPIIQQTQKVKSLSLFQSEVNDGGVVYTPIHEFKLEEKTL